jgi:hypothetical protein
MSDRAAWLEQRCPECRAAPGARCSRWRRSAGVNGRAVPSARLHVARGWFERRCLTCKEPPGQRCVTPTGREAARVHIARLRPTRGELVWRPTVWEELERRGATVAIVPFSGRSGRSGCTHTIKRFSRSARDWSTSSAGRHATSSVTRSRRRCGIASGPFLGTHKFGAKSSGQQKTGAW